MSVRLPHALISNKQVKEAQTDRHPASLYEHVCVQTDKLQHDVRSSGLFSKHTHLRLSSPCSCDFHRTPTNSRLEIKKKRSCDRTRCMSAFVKIIYFVVFPVEVSMRSFTHWSHRGSTCPPWPCTSPLW